jgi:hypothetical protein
MVHVLVSCVQPRRAVRTVQYRRCGARRRRGVTCFGDRLRSMCWLTYWDLHLTSMMNGALHLPGVLILKELDLCI